MMEFFVIRFSIFLNFDFFSTEIDERTFLEKNPQVFIL